MTGPRIYTAAIPATAGNAAVSIVVPTGGMYRFLYGQIVLTTDATVASRRIIVQGRDSAANVLIDIHAGTTVPASQTAQHHEFMQGVYRETSFIGSSLQVPVPADYWLSSGGDFNVTVNAGVAGDSYSGYLRFEFQEQPPY